MLKNVILCTIFLTLFRTQSSVSPCILITAPHGLCLPTTLRTCDKVATQAAHALHRFLPQSYILISDQYRENTDLNREEARPTVYRAHLKKWLQKYRAQRRHAIVCDIHSFPPEVYDIVTNTKNKIIPDLYFIQAYYDHYLALFLYNFMQLQGIPVALFQGSYKNDILLEATYHHIPSLIIEFNEGLSTERLTQIVHTLAQALNAYMSGHIIEHY